MTAFYKVSLLAIAVSLPTPALAQIMPARSIRDTGIAVIVVTATKRSENMQNLPVAISAISTGTLNKKGVCETSDLDNQMPNLQVSWPAGVDVDEV